jgi:uncharacterized protein YndB with AHSA1/START domain
MTEHVDLQGDQLIAERHLDADPEFVWMVLTTPEHLAAFWGGNHASVQLDSVAVDLRVGGAFVLETRGSDGRSHALRFRYDVIDRPSYLVLSEPRTGITTEIRLVPSGGGTTVMIHQRRLPPELQTERARTGLAGILDRLEDVVRTLTNDDRSRHA